MMRRAPSGRAGAMHERGRAITMATGIEGVTKATSVSRRDDFDIPPGEVYVNGAYYSPLPRAARAALAEAYDLKATLRAPWDGMFRFPDEIRARLGRVTALPAEDVGIPTH